MGNKIWTFSSQLVGQSLLLASIMFSLTSTGGLITLISQNKLIFQHQQVEDIARLVHDVERIKNS